MPMRTAADARLEAQIHRERTLHGLDVASRPATVVATRTPGEYLDDQARRLAAQDPPFGGGWALVNAGRVPIVALDENGNPVGDPVSDVGSLIDAGMANPGRWWGLPVGSQFDLLALEVDEDGGWQRLIAAGTETVLSAKQSRINAELQELGIPDMAPVGAKTRARDLFAALVVLEEVRPPAPQVAWVSFGPFDDEEDVFNATRDALPKAPRQRRILCWRWPAGWSAPDRKAAAKAGLIPVAAVPVNGARTQTDDGTPWVSMSVPADHHLTPPPAWLVDALGCKQAASRG